ncbi:DUF2199 domain-containing protein [Sphingomonas suaedae]|uniref:DUF2199 domain-containing protein n=1 Tax=Sphingomonas suaedae TaxID=2599297 RepID=A0A518RJ26_9SPHN|nr:DUF2199 domain-containing protein [Sphingomonas suaedae]QDX27442.1 DUF2199 domain-containing protein [Sphingomonas suaedae]
MSWFRRAKPANPFAGNWTCAGCGEVHQGMMDLAALAPDPWPHERIQEPNSAVRLDGDFLSEDFCVMDSRYFFVRAVLEIPVHGQAEKFGFGCWSTLSRDNFEKYLDGFDNADFANCGPWTGWLCNQLGTYIGTDPEGVYVYPQPDRQRPTLRVANPDHGLAIDQEQGISVEQLTEILRFYGHAPTA